MKTFLAATAFICFLGVGVILSMPLYGCGCAADCAALPVQINVALSNGMAPATLTGTINGEPIDCSGGCGFIEADVPVANSMIDVDLTDGTESFTGSAPARRGDACCAPIESNITLR